MTEKFDVVILGAGLFGAALAYHVARGTSLRALALDRPTRSDQPSASATSAGVLSVQGWDPWDLAVVRETIDEYAALTEETGIPSLRRNGGLRVARTEEGSRWLARIHGVLDRRGVPARLVTAPEIRELLPTADLNDVRTGLHTPDDSTVDPIALHTAYLRSARESGAEIRQDASTASIDPLPHGGWRLGSENEVVADRLVVAAGAWSKAVLAALGHRMPLSPFRAQAARLRPRPLTPEFPTLHDLDLNLYVRPAPLGRLLAGDGTGLREENPSSWDARADSVFVRSTVEGVRALFPGLPEGPVEASWAGLCVASPDRYPLVGRVAGNDRLLVATGFNGFGTMRAGALARRLAAAVESGDWSPLAPADPGRFPASPGSFDPRPEFPLEDPAPTDGPTDTPAPLNRSAPRAGRALDVVQYRLLRSTEEVDRLGWAPLSEWFDPFLALFAKDAIRTSGQVEVAEADGVVCGLLLTGSSEGVGSGFTRRRRVAERYLGRMEPGGLYLEQSWWPGGEPVEIYAADLRDWTSSERLRNPVKFAQPDDLPRLRSLMRGELGPGVDRWLDTLPRPEENAFFVELDGRMVGVSWLSRVGRYGRGHSFVVHPRYRGLGVGSDLLTARMLWLQRTGGRQVVSEIYDGNVASRTAAERAGMALVGRMYHYRRSPRP